MKNNICALLCIVLLLTTRTVSGQIPPSLMYHFEKTDYLSDVLLTSDGNLLLTGYAITDTAGYFIAKYSIGGAKIWSHYYRKQNPFWTDYITGKLLETENGYFLSAYVHKKGLIRKFSKDGAPLWDKVFELNTSNIPKVELTCIVQSSQHKILAAGSSGKGAGGYSFVYLTMDTDGTNEHLVWSGEPKTQAPVSLIPMHDGGSFLITNAGKNYSPPDDVFPQAYRMDGAGNVLWDKKMVLPFNASATQCIRTSDDHLLMIGGGLDSVFIMKMDTFCNPVWIKTAALPGLASEISMGAVTEKSNGHLLLSGSLRGSGFNDASHPLLLETDMNGNLLWAKNMILDETVSVRVKTILPLTANHIMWCATGRTGPYYDPAAQNIYLISSDSTGNVSCPFMDTSITFHSSGLLYLIDEIPGTYLHSYFITSDDANEIPDATLAEGCPSDLAIPLYIAMPDLQEASCYPNPANDIISFHKFSDPAGKLKIFDSYGRQVFNTEFIFHTLTLHVSEWKPGIYFYVMESEAGNYKGKFEIAR